MSGWPYLLLLLPAVGVVWEDFRTRRVHIGWFAALALAAWGLASYTAGVRHTVVCMALNTGIMLVLTAGLMLWQFVRRKPFSGFWQHSMGAGDAVMMWASTPLFEPAGYVRWLIVSCCAALVCWCFSRRKTIPLAGVMSLILAGWAILKTTGVWK